MEEATKKEVTLEEVISEAVNLEVAILEEVTLGAANTNVTSTQSFTISKKQQDVPSSTHISNALTKTNASACFISAPGNSSSKIVNYTCSNGTVDHGTFKTKLAAEVELASGLVDGYWTI